MAVPRETRFCCRRVCAAWENQLLQDVQILLVISPQHLGMRRYAGAGGVCGLWPRVSCEVRECWSLFKPWHSPLSQAGSARG